MQGNWQSRPCMDCGWWPTPREYRRGDTSTKVPDWRQDPSIMSILFARRPDVAQAALPGARLFAAITENV